MHTLFVSLAAQPAPTTPELPASAPQPGRDRYRLAIAAVIVVVWAVWIVGSALATPTKGTVGELRNDIALGRVTAWQLQKSQPEGLLDSTGHGPSESILPTENSRFLVWEAAGRTHWIETADLAGLGDVRSGGPSDNAIHAWMKQNTHRDSAFDRSLDTQRPWFVAGAGAIFLMLALATVIFGPAPRRGTRWFWFWMIALSLGIGVIAMVWVELIRPKPMPHKRIGGVAGFFLAIAIGTAMGVFVSTVSPLL